MLVTEILGGTGDQLKFPWQNKVVVSFVIAASPLNLVTSDQANYKLTIFRCPDKIQTNKSHSLCIVLVCSTCTCIGYTVHKYNAQAMEVPTWVQLRKLEVAEWGRSQNTLYPMEVSTICFRKRLNLTPLFVTYCQPQKPLHFMMPKNIERPNWWV